MLWLAAMITSFDASPACSSSFPSFSVIKLDPYGRSRGFGFILFADSPSVEKVLNEESHSLKNKKIEPKKVGAYRVIQHLLSQVRISVERLYTIRSCRRQVKMTDYRFIPESRIWLRYYLSISRTPCTWLRPYGVLYPTPTFCHSSFPPYIWICLTCLQFLPFVLFLYPDYKVFIHISFSAVHIFVLPQLLSCNSSTY